MSAVDYWDELAEAEQVGIPAPMPVVHRAEMSELAAPTVVRGSSSPFHHPHYCAKCRRVHYYLTVEECAA